jgi:hypothetical protein
MEDLHRTHKEVEFGWLAALRGGLNARAQARTRRRVRPSPPLGGAATLAR